MRSRPCGSMDSTKRKAKQTATAKFYSGNAFVQFNTALRDQVTVRKLDIVDAARMFAAVDMSLADAIISIWHSKYLYAFWRPITAIQLADTDGNPATTADPNWQPMLATPPYPDYVSGYSGLIGALTRALQDTFHTQHFAADLHLHCRPERHRFYNSGKAANQRSGGCESVVGHPLPHCRCPRCADGPTGRGMGTRSTTSVR